MTRKDNIIYYSITAAVFVLIIVFSILVHAGGDAPNEGNPSTSLYVAMIGAVGSFISAGSVIISTIYVVRKTRRDRVDELKLEMQVLFPDVAHEVIVDYTNGKFFDLLDSDFQSIEYKNLHQCAFDELRYEGKNRIVDIRKKYDDAMARGIPIPMS